MTRVVMEAMESKYRSRQLDGRQEQTGPSKLSTTDRLSLHDATGIGKPGDIGSLAIAFFIVGWDQLASSAGPPSENVEKSRWAGAT